MNGRGFKDCERPMFFRQNEDLRRVTPRETNMGEPINDTTITDNRRRIPRASSQFRRTCLFY
jgi:hypothetical protein